MRELTYDELEKFKITNLKGRVFEGLDRSGTKWLVRILPDKHLEKCLVDTWDNDKRYPFRRTNRAELNNIFSSKELKFLKEV